MEQLRTELSHLLGEKPSRIGYVNEKADTALWALYDSQGNSIPLVVRSFSTPGKVRQLARKTIMLVRSGTVCMSAIYGVTTHEEYPGSDVLLLERMCGVLVEAPARTPERWEQPKDQIVEALLVWHRQDSHGCVGAVDNTQGNFWSLWYRQHVEVLWTTFNRFNNTGLTMQDKRILFHTRECLPALLEGLNNNCALIHGNLRLCGMLKDSRNDQSLTTVGPGLMLRVLQKYGLFRLVGNSLVEDLLWSYLQYTPVAESFIWRCWLYMLWNEVAQLVNTG